MVHHRLNEKENNPNPHINFITSLPAHDQTEQESARQLLRALSAQVRPIMKSHGFSVNSLEEYEYNNVFAGRNWNAGETVELVLRRPDRTFMPTFWLMSTLCHELAHIKHMNHGPAFQSLWRQLNAEVRALQDKGYYGDGYWSSGKRLADSARVAGEGIEPGELPEFMCGGAQSRQRPTALKRHRKQRSSTVIPSNSTGQQTAKPRKAGSRITSKSAFAGKGELLKVDVGEGKSRGKGTGFGKRATSKRARDERALAAEQRILALQVKGDPTTSSIKVSHSDAESQSDDDEVEFVPETDADRRQTLLASEKTEVMNDLKSGALWNSFEQDFNFDRPSDHKPDTIEFNDNDLPTISGSTGVSGTSTQKKKERARYTPSDDDIVILPATKTSKALSTDMDFQSPSKKPPPTTSSQWACLVCTLCNQSEHLACSACGTLRGERTWKDPGF